MAVSESYDVPQAYGVPRAEFLMYWFNNYFDCVNSGEVVAVMENYVGIRLLVLPQFHPEFELVFNDL